MGSLCALLFPPSRVMGKGSEMFYRRIWLDLLAKERACAIQEPSESMEQEAMTYVLYSEQLGVRRQ